MDAKEVVKEEQRRLQSRFNSNRASTGTSASSDNAEEDDNERKPAAVNSSEEDNAASNANASSSLGNDADVKRDIRNAAGNLAATRPGAMEQTGNGIWTHKGSDSTQSTSRSHLVQAWADTAAQSLADNNLQPLHIPVGVPALEPGAYAMGAETETLAGSVGNTGTNAVGAEVGAITTATANSTASDVEVGNIQVQVISNQTATAEAATVINQELTEAEPVSFNPHNLPTAQQFDQAKHRAIRRRKNCILASKWIAFFLAVLILVTVIPLVFLQQSSNDTESTTSGTATQPLQPPSQTSSSTPNLSTEDYILNLFPPDSIAKIKTNPQSPQALAFQWLIRDPYLVIADIHLNTFFTPTKATQIISYPNWRLVQRFALATFYYASQGEMWFNNQHWLNYTVHECEWFTRTVLDGWPFLEEHSSACEGYDNSTATPVTGPAASKSNETYTELWLKENNLQGDNGLPEELYLLTGLRSISLAANPLLQGTLSSAIGQLSRLQTLHAAGMEGIIGNIPTEIGLLTELRDMFIMHSNLVGEIPTELGLLTNLAHMFIDTNQLTGNVPSELGLLSDSLLYLYLFSNALTGQLPTELGELSLLIQLSLDMNMLSGTIPTEFGQLSVLNALNPSRNFITGTIPSELGLLATNLTSLNIKVNKLSGTLPTELGLLSLCRGLHTQENYISGTIPSEYGLLSSVRSLILNDNNLSGTIPWELELLVTNGSLVYFDVTNNTGLSGTVPDGLCLVGYNVSCPYTDRDCATLFDCSPDLCGCGNCSCAGN